MIVDASVALKWVLPEPGSDAARALHGSDLAAPEILLAEAANALWRHAITGRLSSDDATRSLQQLLALGLKFLPIEDDAASALALAIRLNHPAYDCFYLAAAIRERSHLVTADTRFAAAVRRHVDLKRYIRLLGES
jgi:predicted nucleic acid-binding protein